MLVFSVCFWVHSIEYLLSEVPLYTHIHTYARSLGNVAGSKFLISGMRSIKRFLTNYSQCYGILN